MTRLLLSLLLCFVAHALPVPAQTPAQAATPGASEWVSTNAIHSQLVASQQTIRAGQTFNVAWHIKTDPDWHVYWSNPGDSGLPPALNPANGFKAGPLAFPTPHVIKIPPITNYGYTGEIILTAPITAPSSLPQGAVEVPVNLSYLYCSNEVCMPGRISATLPLAATLGQPTANPAFADLQTQQAPTLPQPLPSNASLTANIKGSGESTVFELHFNPSTFKSAREVRFLPAGDGMILDNADQPFKNGVLTLRPDPQTATPPQKLSGLLVVDGTGYQVDAPLALAPQAAATTGTPEPATDGLFWALAAALLAGLILNLMPCVLPVLALKALALAKGHQGRAQALRHALGYTLGVLVTFMGLGAATLLLQNAGHGIGWGFQLQQPLFVAALAALMLLLALSFFGVVEVGTALTRLGHTGRAQHFAHDFLTGLLAVVVATPCTVPFMGGAVAYALTQPAPVTLLVFAVLGLGMAAPLVALTLLPGLAHLLPKPGGWLVSFRQLLGWPMLATGLWLLWVYHHQTDALHFFALMGALLALAFGLWLYGRKPNLPRALVLILLALAGGYTVVMPPAPQADWQPWSATEVDALRPHRTVFVDFTADWCLTCKVNEATVLNTARTQALFAQKNVALFKADWTLQNPEISAELEKHGRRGVPLYLLYKPGEQARVLPQILTYGELEQALQ